MEILKPLLIGLLIASLVWWGIQQFDLPAPIKTAANIILVIVAVVFLLRFI